jgi:hypothetical protein
VLRDLIRDCHLLLVLDNAHTLMGVPQQGSVGTLSASSSASSLRQHATGDSAPSSLPRPSLPRPRTTTDLGRYADASMHLFAPDPVGVHLGLLC